MDNQTKQELLSNPELLEQLLLEAKQAKSIPADKFESLTNAWLCNSSRPQVGESAPVHVHGRTITMQVIRHVGEFGGIVQYSGVRGYCRFFGQIQSNLPNELLAELERAS